MEPDLRSDSHVADQSLAAPPWSRIRFAPPEDWTEPEPYDSTLKGKEGAHLTHLLWMRQVNIARSLSFHVTATRLETTLAVQNQSQWQIGLDARSQFLTLHWVRIVRAGHAIDHLHRDRMRVIQREAQLDHLIINGTWTLLLVLDDVRPGDVLEAAYTYETRHPILDRNGETFFYVPPQTVVGRYRLSVCFPAGHPHLAAQASEDAPARTERVLSNGLQTWVWTGSQTTLREPEQNQPSSFLDYTWIQVSALSGWPELITQLAISWDHSAEAAELDCFPEFARPAVVNEAAVLRLVAYIQEEFRYLSIELEAGGWIPASPSMVAQRRYGDCKDLAWLTVNVLRRWGVPARPILVATGLRSRVEAMLPMALLFNHAVMEVVLGEKSRWFDLTMRSQGGDFDSYSVGWYSHGLPVDARASGLALQPGPRTSGLYALRETILLDTRKSEPSHVELRVWAEGWQADNLRSNRLAQGAEEFAKNRLSLAKHRYRNVTRTGILEWRDDRERNVCELVEAFEISDVLYANEGESRATFDVPPNLVMQWLSLPEDKTRRGPWDMPFPLEIRHQISVRAPAMGEHATGRRKWANPEFNATVEDLRVDGIWTKTASFIVLTDAISANRLPEYRRNFNQFLEASSWRLFLPWGKSWTRKPKTFGTLPPREDDVNAYVPVPDSAAFASATTELPVTTEKTTKVPWLPFNPNSKWFWIGAFIFLTSIIRSCSEVPH